MEKKILVDGNETTFREFLHVNTEQDGQIEWDDIMRVYNALPGESLYVGIVEIKII